MINSGTGGTSATMGLKQCYDSFGNNYAAAVRCYNSGPDQVDWNDFSKVSAGVASYVSDIGNIVMGTSPAGDCGF